MFSQIIYKVSGISRGRYRKVWEGIGGYGKLWEAMGSFGKLWEGMGSYGKLWKAMGSYGKGGEVANILRVKVVCKVKIY